MNDKFDELAKDLAQSVTRRGALKKFGVGLSGMALTCFGLTNKAKATSGQGYCGAVPQNIVGGKIDWVYSSFCVDPSNCTGASPSTCPPFGQEVKGGLGAVKSSPCGYLSKQSRTWSF